jgi:DNA-binding IclR family transcriptional regulator
VTSTGTPRRPQIQSVARAAAILHLLSGPERRLGVMELARRLGPPKGTIHGILGTLERHGFVDQDADGGKYELGAALLPLGFAYLHSNRLRAAALGPAYSLALRTGESVLVSMLSGKQAVTIHHLPARDDRSSVVEIGRLVPAHATALGKALLSQHPALIPELAAEGLQRFTEGTIADAPRLRRSIAQVGRRGWAGEIGEHSPGLASVAAPIPAAAATDPGAIALEGSIERLCDGGAPRKELIGAVIETARAVARALGARPVAPGRP